MQEGCHNFRTSLDYIGGDPVSRNKNNRKGNIVYPCLSYICPAGIW